MFHCYKIVLLVGLIMTPLAILGTKNSFDSAWRTALRFALAIAAVWAYLICVRLIVVLVDLALATDQEQERAIYDGDGAKNAFVLLFGWLPGLVLASSSWACFRAWRWFKYARSRH